jgi:hypothetical protein
MDDRSPSERAREVIDKARAEAKRLGGELRQKVKEANAPEKMDEVAARLRQLSVKAATWVEKHAHALRLKLGDPAVLPKPPKKAAPKRKRTTQPQTAKAKATGEVKPAKRKTPAKRKAPAKSKVKKDAGQPQEQAVAESASGEVPVASAAGADKPGATAEATPTVPTAEEATSAGITDEKAPGSNTGPDS